MQNLVKVELLSMIFDCVIPCEYFFGIKKHEDRQKGVACLSCLAHPFEIESLITFDRLGSQISAVASNSSRDGNHQRAKSLVNSHCSMETQRTTRFTMRGLLISKVAR